ncbi:unnamed protein product, partial [Hymenolepis diminuta]
QRCSKCQQAANFSSHQELVFWPKTAASCSHIHLNFARHVNDFPYLVVIDSHSKWSQLISLKSAIIIMCVGNLCHISFSAHGLTEAIVADYDAQFPLVLFNDFWYHPRPFSTISTTIGQSNRAIR